MDQQKRIILLIELGIHPKIQQSQMRFSSSGRRRRDGRGLNRSVLGALRHTDFDSWAFGSFLQS
jgi:hypothetical protein